MALGQSSSLKKALRQFKTWIRLNISLEDPMKVILDIIENTAYLAALPDPPFTKLVSRCRIYVFAWRFPL